MLCFLLKSSPRTPFPPVHPSHSLFSSDYSYVCGTKLWRQEENLNCRFYGKHKILFVLAVWRSRFLQFRGKIGIRRDLKVQFQSVRVPYIVSFIRTASHNFSSSFAYTTYFLGLLANSSYSSKKKKNKNGIGHRHHYGATKKKKKERKKKENKENNERTYMKRKLAVEFSLLVYRLYFRFYSFFWSSVFVFTV